MMIMPLNWGRLYNGSMFYTEDKVTQPTWITSSWSARGSVEYIAINSLYNKYSASNSASISASLKPIDIYYNTNYVYLTSSDVGSDYKLKDGDISL